MALLVGLNPAQLGEFTVCLMTTAREAKQWPQATHPFTHHTILRLPVWSYSVEGTVRHPLRNSVKIGCRPSGCSIYSKSKTVTQNFVSPR